MKVQRFLDKKFRALIHSPTKLHDVRRFSLRVLFWALVPCISAALLGCASPMSEPSPQDTSGRQNEGGGQEVQQEFEDEQSDPDSECYAQFMDTLGDTHSEVRKTYYLSEPADLINPELSPVCRHRRYTPFEGKEQLTVTLYFYDELERPTSRQTDDGADRVIDWMTTWTYDADGEVPEERSEEVSFEVDSNAFLCSCWGT